MFVTLLTFHLDKSSLNSFRSLNKLFMSFTCEVPQFEMSPYFFFAAALSSNQSFTPALSSASLAKVYWNRGMRQVGEACVRRRAHV